jgi:hypothetical protein
MSPLDLCLSVRASNCIQNAGVRTIGELTKTTPEQLIKTKNFGLKSLAEIEAKLACLGLSLLRTCSLHTCRMNIAKEKKKSDSAERVAASLRDALSKYGRHLPSCATTAAHDDWKCSCGFRYAIDGWRSAGVRP